MIESGDLRVTSVFLAASYRFKSNRPLITPIKLLVTWCKLLPTLLLLLRMLPSLSTLFSLHRRSKVSMQLLLPTAPRLTATWTALLQTIWKLHKTPLEFLSSLTLLVPWKAHLASLNSLLFNNSRKPPVTPFKCCFSNKLAYSFRRSIKTWRTSLATLKLLLLTPITSWETKSWPQATISACSLTASQLKV